ncbi:MAG: 5'/3'-nucleotidase SurE [Bacteroidia bacterium]|nr:5'/3'-nucleotidase SurE [Bacteroidia bacterium]
MKKRPLILVTNDDGYTARGIRTLIDTAKKFGDVLVVAPDKPQSGMGHAITINDALRLRLIEKNKNYSEYSCSGTPVDCVKLAIANVLKRKPDLILSGINHGSNSSISVIYSGTMSAAVEGAIEGIPAIGFSLCDYAIEANFSGCVPFIEKIITYVLKKGMDKGTCLNINFPEYNGEGYKGIKVGRQAKAIWIEQFDERNDPNGRPYYWLTGYLKNSDNKRDTDEYALSKYYVSVVPVQCDMTAYKSLDKLKALE